MDQLEPQPDLDPSPVDQPIEPGRRTIHKRPDEKAAPSDNLANVIVYLSNLYTQIKDDEQRPKASSPTGEPGQKVLQAKRLPRSGASLEQRVLEFGDRDDAVSFTNTALGKLATSPYPSGWGKGGQETPRGLLMQRWGTSLLVLCAALLVALIVMTALYLQGRGAAPGRRSLFPARVSAVARGEEGGVSDDALKFAGFALDAIGRGDLKKASELLEESQNRQIALPGVYYQGALLALSQRDEKAMDLWTDRAMEANENVAECLYLRANNEAFSADFKAATESMELAARNAPFNPRYYFFWAECLRREGKPRLAQEQFKKSLQCRPGLTDADLILFKTGLSRIETPDDEGIRKDLADRLAQEPVAGDTLLLAAANEISRNAYPAAAELLQRASRAMPPATLRLRLRDYLFRSQAEQPDIAPVWKAINSVITANVPLPPGHRSVTDPATRGLAEADPAGW